MSKNAENPCLLQEVLARIVDSAKAIKWFSDNYMKLNEDKCHLLTFGNTSGDSVSVKIGSSTIANSTEEKLP